MRAVVVYESMYGSTKQIAEAIAAGLSIHAAVTVAEVGSADAPAGLDLLVTGGPTHAHGMSRRSTRDSAAKEAPRGVISGGIGMREWIARLSPAPGALAATFDTRFEKPRWLTGSAALGAARRLRRLGYDMVAPAESFWISGPTGPLADGEMERARRWGELIGAAAVSKRRPGVR